jgi:hypothetical protein
MATKTTTEEKKTTAVDTNSKEYWEEKIPYTIPFDRSDNSDVFVAVNGKSYLIQREVEVMLPRNVVEVLENSRRAEYEAYKRRRQLSDEYENDAKKYRV